MVIAELEISLLLQDCLGTQLLSIGYEQFEVTRGVEDEETIDHAPFHYLEKVLCGNNSWNAVKDKHRTSRDAGSQ